MTKDFESPILQYSAEQLVVFGYEQVAHQEGYDPQGRYVNVKVYYCERNGLQVTLQATRVGTTVDTEWEKLDLEEVKTNENG